MQRQGLFRSRTDKVIGGVAGGIARALNADPAIIRIVFALLIIFGGGGILLYIILWIAIPEEPFEFFQAGGPSSEATTAGEPGESGTQEAPPVFQRRRNNGALVVGLIFIIIGAVFLADRLLPDIRFHFHDFWPVALVIAGIALIFTSFSGFKRS
jgi:phage shock protein PspC (stress-responsive transcriptional regulator)